MTVKLTLPNNLDNSVTPKFCDPTIRDPELNRVSFTNWGRINFPLTGGEVVLTSEPATTAGNYFLDLDAQFSISSVRVVLLEVTKTGSSEPILKVADIVRTRHQVLLYLDKETNVTFSVDTAAPTTMHMYLLDEFIAVSGGFSDTLITSAFNVIKTLPKGFTLIRFFIFGPLTITISYQGDPFICPYPEGY